MKIVIELSDEQLHQIAAATAEIMRGDKPYTVAEAAEALRWSRQHVYRMIEAGEIRTLPGGAKRIPIAEMKRLKAGQTREDG